MKINISGKGMIPGMGVLPPVYNVEKSETDVRRLINFRNIRVYCSENGLLITKKNVDSFFEVKPIIKETGNKSIDKNNASVVQNDVVEKKIDKTESIEVVEDTSVDEEEINNTEESIDKNTEPSVEKEECVDDKTEEDVTPVDEEINPTTAPVEEEQPKQTYSSKKKNRNKNRK